MTRTLQTKFSNAQKKLRFTAFLKKRDEQKEFLEKKFQTSSQT